MAAQPSSGNAYKLFQNSTEVDYPTTTNVLPFTVGTKSYNATLDAGSGGAVLLNIEGSTQIPSPPSSPKSPPPSSSAERLTPALFFIVLAITLFL